MTWRSRPARPSVWANRTIKLLIKGDTLEDLAKKLNMPRLVETVTKYNADIDAGGVDMVQGRDTMVGPGTPKITKLDKAPFYAFENTAWLAYDPTCSFKVNKDLHLVDQFGKPVQRLYLAGEIMLRSVVGDHYIYGLATGAGGALGLLAGKLAAAEKPGHSGQPPSSLSGEGLACYRPSPHTLT